MDGRPLQTKVVISAKTAGGVGLVEWLVMTDNQTLIWFAHIGHLAVNGVKADKLFDVQKAILQ